MGVLYNCDQSISGAGIVENKAAVDITYQGVEYFTGKGDSMESKSNDSTLNNTTVYGDLHRRKQPSSSLETVPIKSPIAQVIYQDAIEEGWIKFCRKFYSGEIANKPPHYRETFIWLVVNANHKQGRSSGRTIERGQKFTSYQEIRDALHWFVGARKERYKKHQIEAAMKWLRSQGMIQTAKTTRGIIVTIIKYDFYQGGPSPKQATKRAANPTNELQKNSTINKNEIIKEIKNNKDLERVDNDPDGYDFFISEINRITNKRFRGDRKSRSQFNARLKEGYSVEELLKAAGNCKNDPFHLKKTKYLTPEFITRSDKFDKYLNSEQNNSLKNDISIGSQKYKKSSREGAKPNEFKNKSYEW